MKILIFRVYLIFFATVLITYEQNYCAYIYIQIYILKSFSFRYVSTWKGNTENQRDRWLFSYSWYTASPNFLNSIKSITSRTHVHRLPYRLCVRESGGEPPRKYQFSGGFNANFFGTWTNCSNLFSYCRSNRRPCQLVIIHRAKKQRRKKLNHRYTLSL